MSVVCQIAVAAGLNLVACQQPELEGRGLPAEQPDIYGYELPPEPPLPPPPAPQVTFPPVVVEVEKPVPTPAPPSKTIIKTEYVEVPKVIKAPEIKGPDLYELYLQQAYLSRYESLNTIERGGSLKKAHLETSAPEVSVQAADDQLPNLKAPAEPSHDTYESPGIVSTGFVDNSRILAADRYLVGILEGGVNSQLQGEGTVVIQISRDTFGAHNRFIVVPKGSRMICNYKSANKAGQTRIGFDCKRIILGESRAEIYQLKAQVSDIQGYNGVSGEVDNRWWEKYGSAVITASVGAAFQTSAIFAAEMEQSQNTSVASDSVGAMGESFDTLTSQFLEDKVDLKPVIRIAQGTRVLIKPNFDWYLKTP